MKLCLMDMEFKPLEKLSQNIPVNSTAAREHVNDIERGIRVIKDRSRSVVSELPYTPPDTGFPLLGLTEEENKQALDSSCEEYKAALFLVIANKGKYGTMKKKLDNLHLFEQDAYPKTLKKAKTYLENYQAEEGSQKQHSYSQAAIKWAHATTVARWGISSRTVQILMLREKKAIVQAFQSKSNQGKTGQAHVNVGAADKELQECLDGVANVNVNLDDASIESMDGKGFFDSVGFVSLTGVAFIAPSLKGGRMNCGRNKLFWIAAPHSIPCLLLSTWHASSSPRCTFVRIAMRDPR